MEVLLLWSWKESAYGRTAKAAGLRPCWRGPDVEGREKKENQKKGGMSPRGERIITENCRSCWIHLPLKQTSSFLAIDVRNKLISSFSFICCPGGRIWVFDIQDGFPPTAKMTSSAVASEQC